MLARHNKRWAAKISVVRFIMFLVVGALTLLLQANQKSKKLKMMAEEGIEVNFTSDFSVGLVSFGV